MRLCRSPNRREGSSPAQRCNLVCILRTMKYAEPGSGHSTAPMFTGASSDITFLLDLTRCRPSPGTRLSRARSTTAAPPRPRLRPASRLSPACRLEGGKLSWSGRGWFPRSQLPGRRVRHPAIPLRYRHGYCRRQFAVASRPRQWRSCPEFPARDEEQVRTATQPESAGLELVRVSRGVTEPVSRVCLPVLLTAPGPSGSAEPARLCRGCSHPPRRPPDQAASSFTPPLRRQGNGRSFTSIRNNRASWRTHTYSSTWMKSIYPDIGINRPMPSTELCRQPGPAMPG